MILLPIGAFFVGMIAFRAGTHLMDNAFKAHRRGIVGYYSIGSK